jgi:hypothetical protein
MRIKVSITQRTINIKIICCRNLSIFHALKLVSIENLQISRKIEQILT